MKREQRKSSSQGSLLLLATKIKLVPGAQQLIRQRRPNMRMRKAQASQSPKPRWTVQWREEASFTNQAQRANQSWKLAVLIKKQVQWLLHHQEQMMQLIEPWAHKEAYTSLSRRTLSCGNTTKLTKPNKREFLLTGSKQRSRDLNRMGKMQRLLRAT